MRFSTAILFCCSLFFVSFSVSAQELSGDQQYNPYSIRPVRKHDISFQKSLWWRIDLRQKMNQPLFAAENQITKIIIDAVKAGVLRPFQNDSLQTRMSNKDFNENLKIPGADDGADDDLFGGGGGDFGGGDDWGSGGDWGGGGDAWGDAGGDAAAEEVPQEFFPQQIYILDLKEDILFDRKRSRMYHDIQALTVVIPGEQYPTGLDKPLATFSYKELVENVFVDNYKAIWFNPENTAQHRNLADAFDLRLFSGTLTKYSNPKGEFIADTYSGNQEQALAKSQQYEFYLLEYESNLWSN